MEERIEERRDSERLGRRPVRAASKNSSPDVPRSKLVEAGMTLIAPYVLFWFILVWYGRFGVGGCLRFVVVKCVMDVMAWWCRF